MSPTKKDNLMLFKVCCGHSGCAWSARVELAEAPGDWHPPTVSEVLDANGDPIVVPWAGQPLLDAYNQHYLQVHLPAGQPPMCEWSVLT